VYRILFQLFKNTKLKKDEQGDKTCPRESNLRLPMPSRLAADWGLTQPPFELALLERHRPTQATVTVVSLFLQDFIRFGFQSLTLVRFGVVTHDDLLGAGFVI